MKVTSTIGAFEAKTKLSELLERVRHGEEFTITRHEKPIARLVPVERPSQAEIQEGFRALDEVGRRNPLNPPGKKSISYRQLIEEGRR
jgi:prevent-host-death family protein